MDLNSAGRQPLFSSRMDDKFLATAVAKMKTDALSTPLTSVPLTPATAVSISKAPGKSSVVNGGGAGDSNICMPFLVFPIFTSFAFSGQHLGRKR